MAFIREHVNACLRKMNKKGERNREKKRKIRIFKLRRDANVLKFAFVTIHCVQKCMKIWWTYIIICSKSESIFIYYKWTFCQRKCVHKWWTPNQFIGLCHWLFMGALKWCSHTISTTFTENSRFCYGILSAIEKWIWYAKKRLACFHCSAKHERCTTTLEPIVFVLIGVCFFSVCVCVSSNDCARFSCIP